MAKNKTLTLAALAGMAIWNRSSRTRAAPRVRPECCTSMLVGWLSQLRNSVTSSSFTSRHQRMWTARRNLRRKVSRTRVLPSCKTTDAETSREVPWTISVPATSADRPDPTSPDGAQLIAGNWAGSSTFGSSWSTRFLNSDRRIETECFNRAKEADRRNQRAS